MKTVLFICSGNTCRSPMAEAIARHWLDGGELGDPQQYFVASAGVFALGAAPVSAGTRSALERLGIDADAQAGRSKGLTPEMIRNAALVLAMTEEHVDAARAMVRGEAEHEAKINRLDPSGDMHDPIGMGEGAYHALARRMTKLIPQRLKELLTKNGSPRKKTSPRRAAEGRGEKGEGK